MDKAGCKKCSRWVDGVQTNTVWDFNANKDETVYTKISISMGGNEKAKMYFQSGSSDNKINNAILEDIKYCPYCGMDLTSDLTSKKGVITMTKKAFEELAGTNIGDNRECNFKGQEIRIIDKDSK